VRPIAASYETDGSVFLLWERKANYSDVGNGQQHNEDICGVTYVKKNTESKATVIATFRQPSPVCPPPRRLDQATALSTWFNRQVELSPHTPCTTFAHCTTKGVLIRHLVIAPFGYCFGPGDVSWLCDGRGKE
jgi:hypothetical protein